MYYISTTTPNYLKELGHKKVKVTQGRRAKHFFLVDSLEGIKSSDKIHLADGQAISKRSESRATVATLNGKTKDCTSVHDYSSQGWEVQSTHAKSYAAMSVGEFKKRNAQ